MNFKDFWKANNGHVTFEKSKLTKAELKDIQETIARLQARGLPSFKIISALQKKNAKLSERWQAERAYWTEVKRDDTETVGELGEDIGFKDYKVILSPHACETCRQKSENGSKIFKNADLQKSGYGHVPPFHPNAVLPDTRIAVPKIKRIMRAHYSGEVVKIGFADGTFLSVTENHLVLTRRGFVPAHLLRKGDNIIRSSDVQRILKENPDDDDLILTIAEVFDSAVKSGGVCSDCVPSSSEDFHGDGRFIDGNIDIVTTDSLLWSAGESTLSQHVHEFLFSGVHSSSSLDSLGNLGAVLVALALSSDGIVRGQNISRILGFTPALVHELEGFLDAANYNSRLEKSKADYGTTDHELLSEEVLALSPQIFFDEALSVDFFPYHGDVYDLESASTLYTCNSVITSNCYCILVPES